jgi:hypothetical protein
MGWLLGVLTNAEEVVMHGFPKFVYILDNNGPN